MRWGLAAIIVCVIVKQKIENLFIMKPLKQFLSSLFNAHYPKSLTSYSIWFKYEDDKDSKNIKADAKSLNLNY